jgi:MFS family permease
MAWRMDAANRNERQGGGELRALAAAAPAIDVRAAWITLAVTTLIYTLNVADRFIFSTLLQPIKAEFHLSDTGAASLNLALGLVLMIFGVPAGILADRMSRRVLLAASTSIFSVMTALSGFTAGLPTFIATRFGVGLGEAGCAPPALSLIADRFPPARRGVAMTIFTLGICGGSFLGSSLAGSLSDQYGWRAAMVVFGALGLPLGALCLLLVKEPVRGAADGPVVVRVEHGKEGLLAALAHVYREKALLFVILGGATICTWGWGLLFWTPAFLVRAYGLTTGQSGAVLGRLHLVGGTLGTALVAIAMHWLSRRPARAQIWSVACLMAVAAVASIVAYTANSLSVVVLCLWLYAPVLYMYTGPTYSLINNLSPPHLRAKVVAIFLFATSLGYLILAPLFIGYCSDVFAHSGMDAGVSLRRAMAMFAPLGFFAAAGYAVAGFCIGAHRKSGAGHDAPASKPLMNEQP